MSFEGDKARLVKELADAQKQVRAHYGMAKRDDALTETEPAEDSDTDERETADADKD